MPKLDFFFPWKLRGPSWTSPFILDDHDNEASTVTISRNIDKMRGDGFLVPSRYICTCKLAHYFESSGLLNWTDSKQWANLWIHSFCFIRNCLKQHKRLAYKTEWVYYLEENQKSPLKKTVWELWQYRLWSFQTRGTKLERFLPKNQHTQRNLLNFENWINGGLRRFQKSEF